MNEFQTWFAILASAHPQIPEGKPLVRLSKYRRCRNMLIVESGAYRFKKAKAQALVEWSNRYRFRWKEVSSDHGALEALEGQLKVLAIQSV